MKRISTLLLLLVTMVCSQAQEYNNVAESPTDLQTDLMTDKADTIVASEDTLEAIQLVMPDTLSIDTMAVKHGSWASQWFYNRTIIGLPLIAGGLVAKQHDSKFRRLRNGYLPEYKNGIDNYSQYVPALIMFGLKAAGVESRSSWKRMIVSDVFSCAIMTAAVKGIKHYSHVQRPDGSAYNAFPSGHTATAFMAATMLNKEYGHLSPWVGFGSYTLATATGVMRIANNRHWLSDVMVGAGVGVIATEVGYWLGDLIFKDKGIHRYDETETLSRSDRPSFVSLNVGYNVALSKYDVTEASVFPMKSGSTAGLEGAYFFNPYVGIGGRFSVSGTYVNAVEAGGEGDLFQVTALCAGGYFSYPLTARWLLGSKLVVGGVHYPELVLADTTIPSRNGLGCGTGFSVAYRCRKHYALRLFLDYNLCAPHSHGSGEMLHTLVNGLSFEMTL